MTKQSYTVCAAMCAALMLIAGCGGGDGDTSAADSTEAAEISDAPDTAATESSAAPEDAAAADSVTIGFVPKSFESAFWLATQTGAEEAAEADPSIELIVDAASSEAAIEDQIAIVEDLLARGIDALAIAPSAPDQLLPVLEQAVSDGVPVIIVDSDIPAFEGKTAFIGTDNESAGATGAEFFKEEMPDGGRIGVVDGTAGIQALIDRINGFTTGIEGSGIEIVQTVRAEGCTRDNGVSAVEDLLTANQDLDGIFLACGEPAVGGIQAVKGAGLQPDDLVYVGFDATKDELTAIAAGDEDGSVAQFPETMGLEAVQAAAMAARGEDVEPVIDTGSEVVTEENVAEFQE